MTYLDRMIPGQKGRVMFVSGDSPITRRLTELGLVPGRTIKYLRNAPMRDPLEIQVGSSCLSLRHAEADTVVIVGSWVTNTFTMRIGDRTGSPEGCQRFPDGYSTQDF